MRPFIENLSGTNNSQGGHPDEGLTRQHHESCPRPSNIRSVRLVGLCGAELYHQRGIVPSDRRRWIVRCDVEPRHFRKSHQWEFRLRWGSERTEARARSGREGALRTVGHRRYPNRCWRHAAGLHANEAARWLCKPGSLASSSPRYSWHAQRGAATMGCGRTRQPDD